MVELCGSFLFKEDSTQCFHLILLFPNERKIWLRDRDNGLYGPIEYYCSVVISGLPGDYIAATILGSILYWMFGLRADAGAFFTWLGFFYLLVRRKKCPFLF